MRSSQVELFGYWRRACRLACAVVWLCVMLVSTASMSLAGDSGGGEQTGNPNGGETAGDPGSGDQIWRAGDPIGGEQLWSRNGDVDGGRRITGALRGDPASDNILTVGDPTGRNNRLTSGDPHGGQERVPHRPSDFHGHGQETSGVSVQERLGRLFRAMTSPLR